MSFSAVILSGSGALPVRQVLIILYMCCGKMIICFAISFSCVFVRSCIFLVICSSCGNVVLHMALNMMAILSAFSESVDVIRLCVP